MIFEINTSNFAKSGRSENAISISTGRPHWYLGEHYEKLVPGWSLVKSHKAKESSDFDYIYEYTSKVLDKLDPLSVAKELNGKILLCWCAKDKFCHRHVVISWLRLTLKKTGNELITKEL